MYVISHIYYFVMLLINLKFCTMRFLSEGIALILLILPFQNILDRGRHFDPLSGFPEHTQQGENTGQLSKFENCA